MSNASYDEIIDARGLICPLPVLRARKRLNAHGIGAVVQILTDDPMAVIDLPHFCTEAGHEVIQSSSQGPDHMFVIRRG